MHPKPRKSRILNQFLLFVLPFTIMGVTLTSAGIMWANYRFFQQTIEQDYRNIITASGGEIRLFVDHALEDLEILAWVLATRKSDPYQLKMALTAFNQVNDSFKHVSLITHENDLVASTRWNDDLPFALEGTLFKRAKAGERVISDIQFSKELLPYAALAVTAPGFAKSPYLVCGVLDLKFVWDVLAGITIGENGYIYIMNAEGKYVGHREIDKVLTDAPRLPTGKLEEIREAAEPIYWFEKENQQTFYCLGSYIPDLNWFITLRQPTREIYYYLFRNLYWAGLITVIACIAAVVLGFHRVRRFLKPIATMHRQVQKIGAGDLDEKVTVTETNEIGELGMAFNDMTDSLKQMIEKEIDSAKELAQAEKLAVLGASASKVTHEVGNLLNNVGMAANALDKEPLSDRGKMALEKMAKESDRVKVFIQDYLKFAKPPELKLAPLALDLVVREVAAMHGEAAGARGISFDLAWPQDVSPVPADAQLIYQAFNNLVKNSIEAINGKGRIRISAAMENGHLAVTLEDDGAGIAPEHLDRVFDPFFTTKGNKGTGLGMAIVKSTITAHRGTITCHSDFGKGTRFIIRLPVN